MHRLRHRMARAIIVFSCATACDEPAEEADHGADDESEVCRSQCELAAGTCEEKAFADFANFDGTLAQWSQRCPASSPSRFPFVVEGRCGDGKRLLFTGGGKTAERHYFDESGSFLGLTTGTDVIDEVCQGQGFWPEHVRCDTPEVVRVI